MVGGKKKRQRDWGRTIGKKKDRSGEKEKPKKLGVGAASLFGGGGGGTEPGYGTTHEGGEIKLKKKKFSHLSGMVKRMERGGN